MIGIFLINQQDELAFTQHGKHEDIAGFRFHRDTNMCIVELLSGKEETFDDVMHEDIIRALVANSHALVAHVDDDGAYISQYAVPIKVAA